MDWSVPSRVAERAATNFTVVDGCMVSNYATNQT